MRTAIYVAIAGLIVLAGLFMSVKFTQIDPKDCHQPYPMAFFCSSSDEGGNAIGPTIAASGRGGHG